MLDIKQHRADTRHRHGGVPAAHHARRACDPMIVALVAGIGTALVSTGSYAYIGPGVGMGVFGTLFGLLAALLLAIIGVFWYPLKRLMNRRRTASDTSVDTDIVDPDSIEGQDKTS